MDIHGSLLAHGVCISHVRLMYRSSFYIEAIPTSVFLIHVFGVLMDTRVWASILGTESRILTGTYAHASSQPPAKSRKNVAEVGHEKNIWLLIFLSFLGFLTYLSFQLFLFIYFCFLHGPHVLTAGRVLGVQTEML